MGNLYSFPVDSGICTLIVYAQCSSCDNPWKLRHLPNVLIYSLIAHIHDSFWSENIALYINYLQIEIPQVGVRLESNRQDIQSRHLPPRTKWNHARPDIIPAEPEHPR